MSRPMYVESKPVWKSLRNILGTKISETPPTSITLYRHTEWSMLIQNRACSFRIEHAHYMAKPLARASSLFIRDSNVADQRIIPELHVVCGGAATQVVFTHF